MEFVTTIDIGDMVDVDVCIEYDADINESNEPFEFWGACGSRKTYQVDRIEVVSAKAKCDYHDDNDRVILKDGDELQISHEIVALAMSHADANIQNLI